MKISFDVNNQRQLQFVQYKHDCNVVVNDIDSKGNIDKTLTISNGQFVMLYNLYEYVMKNDIKNSFINPYGKNIEQL